MNCQEFQRYLQLYIDHELPQNLEADFFAHRDSCATCAQQLAEAQRLDALLRETLVGIEVPADLAASVMSALPEQMPTSDNVVSLERTRSKKTGRTWALVACAAAIALCVGIAGVNGESDPQPNLPNQIQIAENNQSTDNPQTELPQEQPTNPEQPPEETTLEQNNPDQQVNPAQQVPVVVAQNQAPTTREYDVAPASTNSNQSSVGVVERPKVAYNTQVAGEFNITILAQHEGASALAPHVKENGNVEYLLEVASGVYQLWQQGLTASAAPVMIGSNATEITRGESNTSVMSWLTNREYVTDISSDNTLFAANIKGENGGLWVSSNNPSAEPRTLSTKGGGNCLEISPDCSKIAFTDAEGKLYVAYLAEGVVLEVFSGNVNYLEWLAESRTLVFSATPSDSAYSNIYRATIP